MRIRLHHLQRTFIRTVLFFIEVFILACSFRPFRFLFIHFRSLTRHINLIPVLLKSSYLPCGD